MLAPNLDDLYKPKLFVPWFLCSSVNYYLYDVSTLSDSLFDKICKEALTNKDWKEHHHSKFIKKEHLSQGSGYNLIWRKLPDIVYGSSFSMRKKLAERGMNLSGSNFLPKEVDKIS